MNIVITGACGGMGYAATKLLKEKGYNIYAGDLFLTNKIEGVKYFKLDVTNYESCKDFFDFAKSLSLYSEFQRVKINDVRKKSFKKFLPLPVRTFTGEKSTV